MPRQNYMFIFKLFRKLQVAFNVIINVGKSFVVRADNFFFAGRGIVRFNLPESVVGLRVNKINAVGA